MLVCCCCFCFCSATVQPTTSVLSTQLVMPFISSTSSSKRVGDIDPDSTTVAIFRFTTREVRIHDVECLLWRGGGGGGGGGEEN